MANPHGLEAPSLGPSVPSSPVDARSRRDSAASLSVASHADREHYALALDKIHTSASQSNVLTTFNDFAPPPESLPSSEPKSTASDMVQQGLSGLYTRFKEAVGAVGKASAQEVNDANSQDGASSRKSVGAAGESAKTSPLPRGESGATASTHESAAISEIQTSGLSSSGVPTSESQTTAPQSSSKASSITTPSTSKTPSLQSMPKMAKAGAPTAVNAAVDPVTAQGVMEMDASAGRATRVEDQLPNRAGGRMSISRPADTPPIPSPSGNASLDSVATVDRMAMPSNRSRRDDAVSMEGSIDAPRSPSQPAAEGRASSSSSSRPTPSAETMRRPAVIDRIASSRGRSHSRSSSLEPGAAASPVSTSAHSSVYHDSFTHNERPQRLQSGILRIPGTTTNEGSPEVVNARLERMRKQVLSKEFWMADETCKECFLCGTPFTAFRRKHHCRTCGCIFDSKCTSSISGQKFGVQGNLRVCKTCLSVINRRYDSGSDDSADESYLPAILRASHQAKAASPATARLRTDDEASSISERTEQAEDPRDATTPMMAIPATRRMGENNRHSAVLEIDMPQLSRPGSSRSLKSLSATRPQSSGHRRHHSKHNILSRLKAPPEERAPFRTPASEDLAKKKPNVNAFHADNIIDPELADYMSDESSEDEQMSSIFATMEGGDFQPPSLDPGRASFGTYLSAGRKHRFRTGEKSISGPSHASRGHEEANGLQNLSIHTRPPRRRNLSTASASIHHLRSPWPKSAVLKGPSASADTLSIFESVVDTPALKRRGSIRDGKPAEEGLSPASLQHAKKLFRQLLQDAEIPNPASWEKALIPILDKCAEDVDPDIRNGDDMDIRHWVKLKRIPGGKPSDTAYVHGVVFTKNLALKSMPRKIRNPRIVIITFPLEYQRHPEQHFMSLQPVIEQEKEYLRMVVNRILNLEPHVLLVAKSVAGLALQYLSEANVAVAYNVKPSVLEAVARIVSMPVISSMDMLTLGARVGVCENFEVKTFVNNEIRGRKKTYIFISGCPKDRGCTIALRGASSEVLARMKRITEFMVYVIYNLKLESCLMRDEFVQVPSEAAPAARPALPSEQGRDSLPPSPGETPDPSSDRPATVVTRQSTENGETLRDAGGTTAAAAESEPSSAENAPQRATEPAQRPISMHDLHSHEQVPDDLPMPSFHSEMVEKYETRILSTSPFVKFREPYLLMKAREQERRATYLKRLLEQEETEATDGDEKQNPEPFQLVQPEMVRGVEQRAPRKVMEVLHAVHDAEYDRAMHSFRTQAKQWEAYVHASADLFDPYSHQNIVVLYSVTCTATKIPCSEPSLVAIEFYNEHPDPKSGLDQDCTLGQYIEDICECADFICYSNGCDRKMHEHHRTYVHDNARLTIILKTSPAWPENFPEKPQVRDDDEDETGICMWNYCKLCDRHFGLMPMSVSTWKYSFGKYLELSFWNRGLQPHPQAGCPHDHQKDHIRYFYYLYRDIAVKVHYDPIDLYEIIVPRTKITWKVDYDLRVKNDVFLRAEDRWNRFMNSVMARLKSIRIDSVLPEKAEACKAEVERLSKKAQEDQAELIRALQDAYMNSKYYEVIPFNTVIRAMLEKVTDWDAAFAKFEADFLSDKDVRQLTIIQLKKMFTDHETKESLPSTEGTPSLASENEEKTTPATSPPGSSEVEERRSQPSDGDASPPQETPLSPAAEPVPAQKEGVAVETEVLLERVEPLDLAAPNPSAVTNLLFPAADAAAEAPEPPSDHHSSSTSSATVSASATSSPAQASAPPPPPTGHMSLTEKVEQLRREQQRALANDTRGSAAGVENAASTPKPAAERAVPRRSGAAVSPPMVRAISHPPGSLPRTQSAIGKLLREQKAQDAGSETQKAPGEVGPKGDKKFADRIGLGALKSHRKAGPSGIPRYVHKRESKVSTLARHFEQLSREFEKERLKDRKQRAAKMHHTRAFLPRSSTRTIVEVYKDVDQAVQEPAPEDDQLLDKERGDKAAEQSSTIAADATLPESQRSKPPETERSVPQERISSEPTSQQDETVAQTEAEEGRQEGRAGFEDEGAESDGDNPAITLDDILPNVKEFADTLERSEEIPEELPKYQKKSLMTMLTNFWAERSASGWPQLEYPINATDHIFFDSDVIIREDEPSSLVAFALNSEDYRSKLAEIRQKLDTPDEPEAGESSSDGLAMKGPQASGPDSAKAGYKASRSDAELERSLLRKTGMHVKYQFTDGSARMTCQIFYAEQFDALRRKCGVADRFVESLSRCLKWDSKGGKTKSVFLKTLDERFVLKSLSPSETSSFLRCAPNYFTIMKEALFHDLPSVIAKMFGFFRVFIKNPLTNTEIKLDLLVMENLFYDRFPSRTFDLKGSMRNRKIQSTGEQNEVLLDENMVEYIYESPLFSREHSKRLLRASVFNDTLFLAKQDVMDYSLMVAVDEVKKEIAVGIIDCIRTYTWDKQLESWIKNRGFAGGGRNRPTVTSPKEYKSRFREAMARYILQSPNCWHTFEDRVVPNTPATPRPRFEEDEL